jgi:hypothetical protein
MALVSYMAMLIATAAAVTFGVLGVLGPAPPQAPLAAAIQQQPPAPPAAPPAGREPPAPARAIEWGPRVAPVPDWNEKAAAAAAQSAAAARQRARLESGRAQVSSRRALPQVITRGDDAPAGLGYAPHTAPSDRFRIY